MQCKISRLEMQKSEGNRECHQISQNCEVLTKNFSFWEYCQGCNSGNFLLHKVKLCGNFNWKAFFDPLSIFFLFFQKSVRWKAAKFWLESLGIRKMDGNASEKQNSDLGRLGGCNCRPHEIDDTDFYEIFTKWARKRNFCNLSACRSSVASWGFTFVVIVVRTKMEAESISSYRKKTSFTNCWIKKESWYFYMIKNN